jgi:lipoprotein-anchoring transpeptidase ErfK/SrfK
MAGGMKVMHKKIGKDMITLLYIIFFFLLYIAMENYDTCTASLSTTIDTINDEEMEDQHQEYNIFIDLTQSMLYLFEGSELVKKYPIAQGKPSTPSPIGVWEIVTKTRNWGSGFGTRWMGLNVPWGVYGIHGTNRPGSIGHRASAGCFRMINRDVEELYDLVHYRTKVEHVCIY